MMVKPASSITPEASITCAGVAPALQHRGDGVEGRVGRRMQVAIKLRRLAQREAAQHLPGMIPERRADLGDHDVARLHAARAWETGAAPPRSGAAIDVTPM